MKTLAVIAVLALAGTHARADDDPKLAEARAYFERGKLLYGAGNYPKAVEEYVAAYKLAPFPELVFNIGQAHRLSGNAGQALYAYEEFLKMAPTGALADEARAHALDLRNRGVVASAEAPKHSAWDSFNASLKVEKPAAVIDMRPVIAVGASATVMEDGNLLAVHGTYVKRVGRLLALAPRAQLGKVSLEGAGGAQLEVQGRALLVVAPYFYVGAGLSLGYSSTAKAQVNFDMNGESTVASGGVVGSVLLELGFVIDQHYEIGLQLHPAGIAEKDFIGEQEPRVTVAAAYRL